MTREQPPDIVSSSPEYGRRFSGPVGGWFLERQTQCTAALLDRLPAGTRVLDVGGAHGQIVPLLVDKGFVVTVLGSPGSPIDALKPWLDTGQVRFDTGDLLALPYTDRSFETVFCFRLLPHVERWKQLVAELCRVARSAVVADYPSRRSLNVAADRLFAAKRRIESDTRPFAVFHPSEIESAFNQSGFGIAAEVGQFFLPMALYRALGSATVARAMEAPARAIGLTSVLGSPRIVRAHRRP